ncbi:MAG: hypothetical protein H6832_18540 [Planctomycetes bacterium]|nr:hypothetical protein [Planctomycetota bacterium]
MDLPFPFGLPFASAFYGALLALTFTMHLVFAQIVLGGTAWLAILGIKNAPHDSVAQTLRNWLPFALGIAITLGVAPLLFLQIVDKQGFYTAGLLGSHRFMAILPALIVGFYLLYLQKKLGNMAHRSWRVLLPILTLLAFTLTGYSWSEQHVLAQDRDVWASMYAASRMRYSGAEVLPRFLFFASTSLPTVALAVLLLTSEAKRCAGVAWIGIAGMLVSAAWLFGTMPPSRLAAWSGGNLAWSIALAAGLATAAAGWSLVRFRSRIRPALLVPSWLVVVLSIAALREGLRIASLRTRGAAREQLVRAHERAFEVGGFPVFVLFALLLVCLLAWLSRRVARELSRSPGA